MRILILFSLLFVFSCKVKKVDNSSFFQNNALETQILKETLAEVLKDSSAVKEMTDGDELILELSPSFGNIGIKSINNQKIKLIQESDLNNVRINSDGQRTYLYIQLDKDKYKDNAFTSTASYTCVVIDEENPKETFGDAFCRGGIHMDFMFIDGKLVGKVRTKI